MSGGRRKSRKPQKYEDMGDLEEPQNSLNPEESPDQDKMDFIDIPKQDVKDIAEAFKSNIFHTKSLSDVCPSSKDQNVDEAAKSSDAEITTSGILSGHRQSFISECKICCIQLKDWKKTYTHLLFHRTNNLPRCYHKNIKDEANAKKFDCLLCNYKSGCLKELVFHCHLEHSASKESMYCSFCTVKFETLGGVYRHMDIKCIEIKCPICSMVSNQEYDFYMHLSGCLGTFHPNITSLKCHICQRSISLEDLANHMIAHSVLDSTQFVEDEEDALPMTPPRPPSIVILDSELFLCDVCDVRFDSEESFVEHGEKKHLETKHVCSLCYMRGFSNPYLLVRHMILRCTQRSIRQMRFGEDLIKFGKAKGKGFLSILKTSEGQSMLKKGLRAWRSRLIVMQFLDAFCSASKEELRNFHTESSSDEFPTDLELVSATTLYQTNVCKKKLISNHKRVDVDPKFIPQLFRGVTLVPNVDIHRLRKVYAEAMKDVSHFNANECVSNPSKLHTERRLEMEAQYLRQMEPFYVEQNFVEDNLSEGFKIEEERYLRLISNANNIKFGKNSEKRSLKIKQEDVKRLKEDAFNLCR